MGGGTPKPENALDVRKIIAGVVVTVLGGVLLKVASEGIERWTAANPPADVAPAASEFSEPQAAALPGAEVTPTPIPRVFDFSACSSACDGSNASTSFPEGTQAIHSRWNYANIPAGSHYVRAWTMNDLEWVRYECTWQGPPAGMDAIDLREPGGFHSGTWTITISVDGRVLLDESLAVQGNETYWDPAGAFDTCYEQ